MFMCVNDKDRFSVYITIFSQSLINILKNHVIWILIMQIGMKYKKNLSFMFDVFIEPKLSWQYLL